MFERFFYSLIYRFSKLNKSLIIGQGNSIVNKGKILGCTIEIIGNNNSIIINNKTLISKSLISIKGDCVKLFIGENCQLQSSKMYLEDINTSIKIGDKTTFENVVLSACEDNSQIIIGNDCMFANNVELRNSDSHAIYDSENNRINPAKDIHIGDHVWIGNNSIVLKGVTINSDSVIGAFSLITKDVEPRSVVGGIPAKLIKQNIRWTRERK